MKRWLVLLMLLIQAVFAVGAEAAIQVPPKPSVSSGIYVQDYAGVLSPQTRQALNAIGQDLDNKTTAQVAVATVKTLDGQPIDEYGLTLLRQWGLGNKEKNNGALILVAVDDRQSRIEVGYGLEGVLPDGLTGRIQDQQMLPYFKQGQYEKGIVQGYLTVATTVAKSYDVKLEGVRYNGGAQQGTGDTPMPGWMKALIAVGLIVLVIVDHMFFGGIITQFILLALLRGGGRGGGGGGFGGGSGGGGGSSRRW
ncbi:MAG: TPM domain-containing protein [Phascolarctobacterium sp.]|nr:TPM domain-containing protein [Phascolarctobacterium sp.]